MLLLSDVTLESIGSFVHLLDAVEVTRFAGIVMGRQFAVYLL
jgi:hypothetical protein